MQRNIILSGFVLAALCLGGLAYLKILKTQTERRNVSEEIRNAQSQTGFLKTQDIQAYTESIKQAFAAPYNGSKIVFDPSISSSEEKNELSIKVLQPYVDFKNETIKQPAFKTQLLLVHKNSGEEAQKNAGAAYVIEEIYNNGEMGMWLEGELSMSLGYWSPQCMGDCKFSEAYKRKYPEVVAEYDRINKK